MKRTKETLTTLPADAIVEHNIQSQQNLEEKWKCIQNTINDPIARSKARTRASLKTYLHEHIDNRPVHDITPTEWMSWIVRWAIPRGRCKYGDNSKGVSPASAKIFFKLMIKILEQDYNFALLTAHPFLYKFPTNWQKSITKDRRYARKQAGFFSQSDVLLYIQFLTVIAEDGTETDAYYASMARVVISVSMLFAGCRLGELLSATLAQLQFVTVRGEIAVAITSLGSKSDIQNQRSSPITFGTLKDKELCPMRWLASWVKRNNWTIKGCRILSDEDEFLFPLSTKRAKAISTNYFTCKDRH